MLTLPRRELGLFLAMVSGYVFWFWFMMMFEVCREKWWREVVKRCCGEPRRSLCGVV